MMVSALAFERATGRPPVQDDLDRVNCDKAGEIGHITCGWCETHNKPQFDCACRALEIGYGR